MTTLSCSDKQNTPDVRKVEVYKVEVCRPGEWVATRMRDLVVGDIFSLFESSGEPVIDQSGVDRWTVATAPKEVVTITGVKTWMVSTKV